MKVCSSLSPSQLSSNIAHALLGRVSQGAGTGLRRAFGIGGTPLSTRVGRKL